MPKALLVAPQATTCYAPKGAAISLHVKSLLYHFISLQPASTPDKQRIVAHATASSHAPLPTPPATADWLIYYCASSGTMALLLAP